MIAVFIIINVIIKICALLMCWINSQMANYKKSTTYNQK